MSMIERVRADAVATQEQPDQPARVCVVIPAYNEAATIGEIVASAAPRPVASCVIVVDDGSCDETGAIAARERCQGAVPSGKPGKGASL